MENVIALGSVVLWKSQILITINVAVIGFAISYVWFYMLLVFAALSQAISWINAPGT